MWRDTSRHFIPRGSISRKFPLSKVVIRYQSSFKSITTHRPLRNEFIAGRDNNWIVGGPNAAINDIKQKLNGLSDIRNEKSLYLKDEKFNENIDVVLFQLTKNVKTNRLIYKDYSNKLENKEFQRYSPYLLRSFEDKLYQGLVNFEGLDKDRDSIKLEDILMPSIQSLPVLVYNIDHPLIQNFFKLKEIEARGDQMYYFFEQTLHQEYRQLRAHRTPPQSIKVDISNPAEWYPKARKIKRKIIMHVGPTNSGKTYNALKRLRESNNGYFAGPLRLLAREIYDRFKSEGHRCNLITGEEIIEDLDMFGNKAPLSSGTVEMVDLNTHFDVVVLDEIQMIADNFRGWAWSSALLGVQADEVHLCGEERAVPLIRELLKSTGDELIINKYERLGKLVVDDKPLYNGIADLERGDCIVVFSKKKILSYKMDIESQTDLKCGVIYGALPAEVRTAEATKFNNGEYDVLVASDAIGMGLNLRINRVIFDDHKKFDGMKMTSIESPHIKQVGGRAGRFKVAPNTKSVNPDLEADDLVLAGIEEDLNDNKDTSVGYVTAFQPQTLDYVRQCFQEAPQDIEKAVIWPEDEIWSHYISEFPEGTPFSTIMKAFQKEVNEGRLFEVATIKGRIEGITIFDTIEGMLVMDQLKVSNIPMNERLQDFASVMKQFALTITQSMSKSALEFDHMHHKYILGKLVNPTPTVLTDLETLHKKLMAWLWMNNRYPTLFVDRETAEDLKNLTEDKIERVLETLQVGKEKKGNFGNKGSRRSGGFKKYRK